MRRLAALAPALFLAGCSLAPDYQPPEQALPATWQAPAPETPATPAAAGAWWTRFGSPELDQLQAAAARQNLDLAAARARIAQAEAALRIAGAERWPAAAASASAARAGGEQGDGSSRRQGALGASYLLDLWGEARSATEAARASLDSVRAAEDGTRLLLQADIARLYIQALAFADRIRIARANLDNARATLALIETRERLGRDSALELAQQRAAVARQEAELPQLQAGYSASLHALALLLGQVPEGFALKATGLGALSAHPVAPRQPAELLARRPDIRRQEALLRAANADIGAARAALLPRFSLSAQGLLSEAGGASSTGTELAAALTAPLFEGGRLRAGVERSRARYDELAADYRRTLLAALQEVEDALVGLQASERRLSAAAEAAAQSRQAAQLAELRFRAGSVDFLTVLSTQQARLSAEDQLALAQQARHGAAVALAQALGGDAAP